jgi:polyhydroxyalkanoate synthesis regulator phasin
MENNRDMITALDQIDFAAKDGMYEMTPNTMTVEHQLAAALDQIKDLTTQRDNMIRGTNLIDGQLQQLKSERDGVAQAFYEYIGDRITNTMRDIVKEMVEGGELDQLIDERVDSAINQLDVLTINNLDFNDYKHQIADVMHDYYADLIDEDKVRDVVKDMIRDGDITLSIDV